MAVIWMIVVEQQYGAGSPRRTAAAEEDEVFSGRQLTPPTASQDDAEEYVDCADDSPAMGTTFDPKGLEDGLESQTTEQFSPSGTLLNTVQIAGVPEIRRQDCDTGSTQGPSEVGEGFVRSKNCGGLALEEYATTNMASNESSIERCKICNYMEASLSTHRKKIEELEIQVTSLTERLQQTGLDKNKIDQLLQMMGSAERERRENAAERKALKELLTRCEVLEKEWSGLLVEAPCQRNAPEHEGPPSTGRENAPFTEQENRPSVPHEAAENNHDKQECLAAKLEDCSRVIGLVGESRKSEGCNRAQDQRRGAPTIEKKESGSPSSTVDDDKLADSVVDSVKLLAGPDDNRVEGPGEKDTSTPAKSKASAKPVVRPPWEVKKEVLIVGDSNVGRFAPAFSEQMGGGQNFDVLLNRKATVEIAHRMIADYEAMARRIPRMYILHVGMEDLLHGKQPDDIVECLEKKWCFRQVALTVCSVPEVTSRGKETQAAAVMLNSRLRKMCKKIHAKYVDLSRKLVNDGFMEKDGLRYSNQGINMATGRLVGLANRFLGRQGKERRMEAQQDREQDGLVNPAQQRSIHEPMNQTAGIECGQTRTTPLLVGHVPCEGLLQQRLSQGAYVRRQQDGEKKDQSTQQGTTTQERHAHSGWQPSMREGTSAYPVRGWVHPGLMRHPTGIGLSMGDAPRRIQEDPPLQYHRDDITAELTPVLDGRTLVYPPPLVRHPMHMSPPAMPPLWLSGLVAETVRQQLGIGVHGPMN
ncbi:hypothetical protein HPB47_019380 [Ixodes persulcatus]|uniref:Uncharacterized protein n=1 Tax=Ixodes persulcatus TaxID=34615 RepID=A0AC60QLW3_IXOPE|nr:hypothetical protein HPB47_019380 [Ixodes persulcatus]